MLSRKIFQPLILTLIALSCAEASFSQHHGDHHKTWDEINKGIRDQPTSAVRWLDKADAEANALEDVKALEDYNTAIKFEPQYAQAFLRRGDCYRHLGNFSKADLDYQQAMDLAIAATVINKGDIAREAADRLATDLKTRGQDVVALKLYDRLVKRFNDPRDLIQKGRYELTLGKLDDASKDLSEGLKKDTLNVDAMGAYGDCLLRQKKLTEAVAEYTKVINFIRRQDKNFTTHHRYTFLESRAKAEKELGNNEAAAADLAESVKIRDSIFDLVPFREPLAIDKKK